MDNLPEKLSPEHIEGMIVDEAYFFTPKSTICVLILKNSFEVIGTAGVIRPELNDPAIGRKVSRQKAVDQVWLVEGYLLQQKIYDLG